MAIFNPYIKPFMLAIGAVGAVRFALTVSGIPDDRVKYASMSVVIAAGTIFFGVSSRNWKQRMRAAYLLILPYMVVELLALGYTWATGRHTIFHAPEYSFNTTLPGHFVGHLVGGLTWEPFFLFLLMEVIAFMKRKLGF